MRMLEDMTAMAARLMNKKIMKEDELRSTVEAGDGDMLPFVLRGFVNESKIDEAENLLFRFCELEPSRALYDTGMDFYAYLNDLSDEEIAEAGWSREEIQEGLADFLAYFPELQNPEEGE